MPPALQSILIPIALLLFGTWFAYSAVRRAIKKLDPASKPSAWTYINELGGYFVIGVLMAIGGIISLVFKFLG